jgi:hypothetical protein
MSPSEGLEILKNWARTSTTLNASSSGINQGTLIFERSVVISSVTPSKLTLRLIDSGEEIEKEDIEAVSFLGENFIGGLTLQLTFLDGTHITLIEPRKP